MHARILNLVISLLIAVLVFLVVLLATKPPKKGFISLTDENKNYRYKNKDTVIMYNEDTKESFTCVAVVHDGKLLWLVPVPNSTVSHGASP